MNYYNEIKRKIIDNEIYVKVKEYSKERNTVITYFEIGKLLYEAGSKYGESVIETYSNKLMNEVGKKYNKRTLFRMRQFYNIFSNEKVSPLATQLSWSHYIELLSLSRIEEILYYIRISIVQNLSRNELRKRIKNKEYERIPIETKEKLKLEKQYEASDFIKSPILIKNSYNYQEISEKILKKIILEDIDNFLSELGNGFSYIKNEYKIKLGDRYNYIDLFLYNIEFNCYVVVELKITELKKEYLGQIETYMNYVDRNIRKNDQDKTIGIIICKKNNKFIMEYCSDNRVLSREYDLY